MKVEEDYQYRMLFAYDFFSQLDKTTQTIYYHGLKNISLETTSVVTSLSVTQIRFASSAMERDMNIARNNYSHTTSSLRMPFFKRFLEDLKNGVSDKQLTERYKESVALVKIMRHLAQEPLQE